VEIFRQYKLVREITNSTILNKLQLYYSQISVLYHEGRTSCF